MTTRRRASETMTERFGSRMDLSLIFEACVAAIAVCITAGICTSLGRWILRIATGQEEYYVADEGERLLLEEHRKRKDTEQHNREEQHKQRIDRGWDAGLR